MLGLENYADPGNMELQHIVDQCLRAQHLMHRDKDYVVKDGVIQLVDEFTGRIMDGRQFADGLHQAIEAKEGVTIREENKTIASTTYQCFFNKYEKISGMTGTAYAEKREFRSTYHLKTVVIPTNKPVQRVDRPSVLYPTKRGKYEGVVAEVLEAHKKGQPVLIGTASIKTSEDVSALLSAAGVPHQILNAKQDAKEAEIISRAGVHGTVTVATNMAGRGTDIILDDEARAAGGLKVIGTELHESSRIDDQLRGRAGRQGDPGESVFFISAEDDMIRLFTRDRFSILLEASGVSYNEPVGGAMFAKYVAQAQRRVEDEHYGMRKNVLDYDLVNDKQRELIYAERRRLLAGEDVHEEFRTCLKSYVDLLVAKHMRDGVVDKEAVLKEYRSVTGAVVIPMGKNSELSSDLKHHILALHRVRSNENEGMSRKLERFAILRSIDAAWTEQLSALECLRQNIWYLSLAQIDPKSAYAMQAFELYESMKANVHRMSVYAYFNHYNVQTQKTVLKINKEGV
jgi:preprotein translocase subunit SecA